MLLFCKSEKFVWALIPVRPNFPKSEVAESELWKSRVFSKLLYSKLLYVFQITIATKYFFEEPQKYSFLLGTIGKKYCVLLISKIPGSKARFRFKSWLHHFVAERPVNYLTLLPKTFHL